MRWVCDITAALLSTMTEERSTFSSKRLKPSMDMRILRMLSWSSTDGPYGNHNLLGIQDSLHSAIIVEGLPLALGRVDECELGPRIGGPGGGEFLAESLDRPGAPA